MISKRGQLENIIALASTALLIIVIMAVFVVVAAGASIKYAPEKSTSSLNILPENELMSKDVLVNINGQQQKMWVLDAIIEYKRGRIKWGDLTDSLKQLLNEQHTSLGIVVGESENLKSGDMFLVNYMKLSGTYRSFTISPDIAADILLGKSPGGRSLGLRKIKLTLPAPENKAIYVQYCYGGCYAK
jgi:hypothetical protein